MSNPDGLDPNSADGFVPSLDGTWLNGDIYQAAYGPIGVAAVISSTPAPEPGTLTFLGVSLVLLTFSRLSVGKRRMKAGPHSTVHVHR